VNEKIWLCSCSRFFTPLISLSATCLCKCVDRSINPMNRSGRRPIRCRALTKKKIINYRQLTPTLYFYRNLVTVPVSETCMTNNKSCKLLNNNNVQSI
jgi:hypothetical protein